MITNYKFVGVVAELVTSFLVFKCYKFIILNRYSRREEVNGKQQRNPRNFLELFNGTIVMPTRMGRNRTQLTCKLNNLETIICCYFYEKKVAYRVS